MKTKLRVYLITLRDRLVKLEAEKETAEKLNFNTECSALSKRIRDCENVILDIENILK